MPKRFHTEFAAPVTLDTEGTKATFDVGSYDGWVIKVVSTGLDGNAIYNFLASMNGDTAYDLIVDQARGDAAGTAIGTAGTVTSASNATVYYYFSRGPSVTDWAVTWAKTIQFNWVSEAGSDNGQFVISIVAAYSDR